MAGEVDEASVVDDVPILAGARHGRLHAVVEDLARAPADRLECGGVAAQQGLEILAQNEAGEDQPAVTEHQREQPDDPHDAGFGLEHDLELSEVDLGLFAGGRLEADLEGSRDRRSDLAQRVGHRGVAAAIAALLQFPQQAPAAQVGIGRDTLSQISEEGGDHLRAGCAWAIGGRDEAALDVFADRLAVEAELAGDGRDRQALAMEIKDHHEFPEFDHRCPLRAGNRMGDRIAVRRPGARPGTATTRGTGENSNGTSGENYSGINSEQARLRRLLAQVPMLPARAVTKDPALDP